MIWRFETNGSKKRHIIDIRRQPYDCVFDQSKVWRISANLDSLIGGSSAATAFLSSSACSLGIQYGEIHPKKDKTGAPEEAIRYETQVCDIKLFAQKVHSSMAQIRSRLIIAISISAGAAKQTPAYINLLAARKKECTFDKVPGPQRKKMASKNAWFYRRG